MNFWDEEVSGITHIDTEPQVKKFRSSLSKSEKINYPGLTFSHQGEE
mgnify:CR=1 FL=1